MSVSILPHGWTRTRVLISGNGSQFTVPLRAPVDDVVFAHVVSMAGAGCIVQVDGLNLNKMSTLTDGGTRVYHHDYLGNNLQMQLAYAISGPPETTSRKSTVMSVLWKQAQQRGDIKGYNRMTRAQLETALGLSSSQS